MMMAFFSGAVSGEFCAAVLVVALIGFEPFCSAGGVTWA
jgi:hypothetical protein